MAYTDPWDESAPLDTQPAKLLGEDIRDFKTDIRERVGTFLSGPLANRPTPEAIWAGLMYWSLDTKQVFQWSGSTWVDVSTSIPGGGISRYSDTTVYTFVNPSADQNAGSITIPAGILQVGSIVEFVARGATVGASGGYSGPPRFRVFAGASDIGGCSLDSVFFGHASGSFVVTASAAERGSSLVIPGTVGATAPIGCAPIDLTVDSTVDMVISVKLNVFSATTETYTLDYLAVKVFK